MSKKHRLISLNSHAIESFLKIIHTKEYTKSARKSLAKLRLVSKELRHMRNLYCMQILISTEMLRMTNEKTYLYVSSTTTKLLITYDMICFYTYLMRDSYRRKRFIDNSETVLKIYFSWHQKTTQEAFKNMPRQQIAFCL